MVLESCGCPKTLHSSLGRRAGFKRMMMSLRDLMTLSIRRSKANVGRLIGLEEDKFSDT
ncbi:hypothetical protein MKW98_007804, partial [Papaver atlanticum]